MEMILDFTEEEKKEWNINDKICCIYQIKNLVNDKIYVGQTKDLRKRISQYHTAVRSDKQQPLIIESIKYFGENCFAVKILQKCEIKDLNALEKKWIMMLETNNIDKGYNTINGNEKGNPNQSSSRKSLAHIGLKASAISKRKRSHIIIGIKPQMFIISDSAKLFADYLGTDRAIISHCVKGPSKYKDWIFYYDDMIKRMEVYLKMKNKKFNRNPEYYRYLKIINKYDLESVETMYDFIRTNIGKLYKLSYDFIDTNGTPCLLEIFKDEKGQLYTKEEREKELADLAENEGRG